MRKLIAKHHQAYFSWLFSKKGPALFARVTLAISGVTGFIKSVYELFYDWDGFNPLSGTNWAIGLEILILIALTMSAVTFTVDAPDLLERDSRSGGHLARQLKITKTRLSSYSTMLDLNMNGFWFYWMGLWLVWLFYYLFRGYMVWRHVPDSSTTQCIVSIANNATSFLVLGGYYFLAASCTEKRHMFFGLISRKLIIPLLIVTALMLCDYVVYFHVPLPVQPMCAYGMMCFEGLVSCVILSMWIGRVDSKFLAPPRALIAFLYGFAAIQVLLPIMSDTTMAAGYFKDNVQMAEVLALIKFILTVFGLLGKVVMFWIITKNLQDGSLMIYFVRLKQVIEEKLTRDHLLLERIATLKQ